jgi:hypothetical protein
MKKIFFAILAVTTLSTSLVYAGKNKPAKTKATKTECSKDCPKDCSKDCPCPVCGH